MARFARAVAAGVAHHITQRGVDQQKVFYADADRRTYLDCLGRYCSQAGVRILAYCLMSNHVHLVAVPEEAKALGVALRRAHGRYSLYLNSRRQRVGHLWQNRYYSCAMDEKHLWAAIRYVERNPVRANLAVRPEEYEWSCAAAHIGLRSEGPVSVLDWQFHASSGGNERWIELLSEPDELLAIRSLQRGTFTGRPVGHSDFVSKLEEQLGRPLAPRQGKRQMSAAAAAGG
jgi:putative transposase